MRIGQRVTPTGILAATAGTPKDQWLELRRGGIGGSDVAALLGLNKYTSARELYHEKRGEFPAVPRPAMLERAARWGHLHEPLIAAEFATRHGLRVRRIGLLRNQDRPWMLANLDRQVYGCPDGPCLLEIKNRSAWKADEWGESGDPEGVPDIEALQTHHYLIVTGYTHAHVAVLINGNDDRYYRVGFDPEIASDLLALEAAFWQRVRDGDPPPVDGTSAATRFLDEMWAGQPKAERVFAPGEVDELMAGRRQLLARCGELDEQATTIGNALKDMLGDAEEAICDGKTVFSWRRNGAFAGKRFAEAHPDLAAKYTHLVPAIDTAALKVDHPDIYRAFRARVLRIAGSRS